MEEKVEFKPDLIIDGEGAVLGRLASFAAKQALLGKDIVIVNCNGVLVSGIKSNIVKEYEIARQRGGSSLNGPHFPKDPYKLVKRTIKGMLSFRQGRGLTAFKRIICYNQVPDEYKDSKKMSLIRNMKSKTLTLKEIEAKL